MKCERWKPVVDWEGVYSVSSLGRVRRDRQNMGSRRGLVLKASDRGNGYPFVCLRVNGNPGVCLSVHRIVAEAFCGPCPSGKNVNHKNGIKTDNRMENLEYVTQQENVHHARDVLGHRYGLRGERSYAAKMTEREVAVIRKRYAEGEISQALLAKEYGVHQSAISLAVRKKTWQD